MTVETFPWFDNPTGTGGEVRRRAIVLPGGASSVESPPLFHVAHVLAVRGWFVQAVRWDYDEAAQADPVRFVAGAADLALSAAPPAATTLVVGKSLGTRGAPWASARDLPAVWLTPLLFEPVVVDAVRASTAPTLLVGGTADHMWDSEVAAAAARDVLGVRVHEVAGGDHGLQIGRDWRLSMMELTAVLSAVEAFTDALD